MEYGLSAARWVVRKALSTVSDGLVEAWGASKNLGAEIDALMAELLYAQAILNSTRCREIDNPALNELLLKLRLLAYDADDVIDELDYFRIQDEVDNTYHAADVHAGGCVHDLLLHAHHTATAVAGLCGMICGEHDEQEITRSSVRGAGNECQPLKLKFERVGVSKRMTDITQRLKPICGKVSRILALELLGSSITTTSTERPITIEESIEPTLYGRATEMQKLVDSITHGQIFASVISVVPILGPGGIGKTTFAQHLYQEVKTNFDVAIWICVSHKFSAKRLAQEVRKKTRPVKDEMENCSDQEVIHHRLKGKKFLLVLDDIWRCNECEWEKLLAPFRKIGGKGNVVIVTTRIRDVANFVKAGDQIELDHLGAQEFRQFFDACVDIKWSERPDLVETGEAIIKKLKGSPLAAKTVGRILRQEPTLGHWRRVLECKEWEHQKGENDIMPALKISFDHLPVHLRHCFSYCALFPEDYAFGSKELFNFWCGLGFLSPGDGRIRIEDIGNNYLTELVNYGFFKKYENEGNDSYIIHDLLHNMAVKVSQLDCLSIPISEVRSVQIPASVRHISIIVDSEDVDDAITFKDREIGLESVYKRMQIEKLRTVLLFGENVASFSKAIGRILEKAKALRTVFLSQGLYVEDMLNKISNLLHLRHLRIKGYCNLEMSLPISKLYHLVIFDMENCWNSCIPSRDLNNLIHVQHIPYCHVDISNVGSMKCLKQLRFKLKNEDKGFELRELGQLFNLETLEIYDLEKVKFKEEGYEANLNQKTCLRELILHWDSARSNKDSAQDEQVLESLKPSGNVVELSIRGHGGFTCPSWLGVNLSVKYLEFLQLDDVSWKILPPLGELWLVDEHGNEYQSWIPDQSFKNLKRVELIKIPKLSKWVGNGPCNLFSQLKVCIIRDCPELVELPFSYCAGYEEKDNVTWFPKLEELEISDCPKLTSLPCIPCSTSMRLATIAHASGIEYLSFRDYNPNRYILEVMGKNVLDNYFWKVLAFHNLAQLGVLSLCKCPPLPLVYLKDLSTLKALEIVDSGDAFYLTEDDHRVGFQFPVEYITIDESSADGERLTNVLSYFPKLRSFTVVKCEKIAGFGVLNQQKKVKAPAWPSPSLVPQQQQEEQDEKGDEEIAAATSEGLLMLPPQLQRLQISDFSNLVLSSDSLNGGTDSGKTGDGGGVLQGLGSLQSLKISGCPVFLSSYSSSSSSCFPFPASLDYLYLEGAVGAATLLPLLNLTSLTCLYIWGCGDLRGEGLWPLLAEGCLTDLTVNKTPNFFTGSEPSLPSLPPKLQWLHTDDTRVLTVSICTFLSSSLTKLNFTEDKEVEHFTKEQEEALQLLTSLERISIQYCNKLQSLPSGLHRLPSLKRLIIWHCSAIQSLPKDGLPSTLHKLEIHGCPAIQSLPENCLPSSLQKLEIRSCPAIRSLPKLDSLPSSLRELDVQNSESKELRRQCRKLIGTIPIVKA